jgi:hypothetical protein
MKLCAQKRTSWWLKERNGKSATDGDCERPEEDGRQPAKPVDMREDRWRKRKRHRERESK